MEVRQWNGTKMYEDIHGHMTSRCLYTFRVTSCRKQNKIMAELSDKSFIKIDQKFGEAGSRNGRKQGG